jgi:hypothetical protein
MADWNSDWIIDRLADLLVLAYVLFFLWSVARVSGWL